MMTPLLIFYLEDHSTTFTHAPVDINKRFHFLYPLVLISNKINQIHIVKRYGNNE